jgi:hypothetical protein
LPGLLEEIVPVDALAATHALAKTGFGGIGATYFFNLANNESHAAGWINDGAETRTGQQFRAADTFPFDIHAPGLHLPII